MNPEAYHVLRLIDLQGKTGVWLFDQKPSVQLRLGDLLHNRCRLETVDSTIGILSSCRTVLETLGSTIGIRSSCRTVRHMIQSFLQLGLHNLHKQTLPFSRIPCFERCHLQTSSSSQQISDIKASKIGEALGENYLFARTVF